MPREPRPLNAELYRGLRSKRCDGQLKRYSSCRDIRAWSLNKYERQSYMRDILAASCNSSENGSDEDNTSSHKLSLTTLLSALLASKKVTEDRLKEQIKELNSDLEKFRQGSQPGNSQTVSDSKDKKNLKESNQNQTQKLPIEDNEVKKGINLQKEHEKDIYSENQQTTKETPEIQPTENINISDKPNNDEDEEITSGNNDSTFIETANTDNPAPESIEESLTSSRADTVPPEPTQTVPSEKSSLLDEAVIEGIAQEKPEELLEAALTSENLSQKKEPIPEKSSLKKPSDDKDDIKPDQEEYENERKLEVKSEIYEYLSSATAISEHPYVIFLTEFTTESNTIINERYEDSTTSDDQIPYEIPLQMDLGQKSQYEKSDAENNDSESINRCLTCGEEMTFDDIVNFCLSHSTAKYRNVKIDEQPYHSYHPPRTVPRRIEELQREHYYQNPINSTRNPYKSAITSKRIHINEDYFNPSHLSSNTQDAKQNPQRCVGSKEPNADIRTRQINLRNQHPQIYKSGKVRPEEYIPPHPQYQIPSNQTQYQARSNIPVNSEFNYQLHENRRIHPHVPAKKEYNPWHHRTAPKFYPELYYTKQLHRNYNDNHSNQFRYHGYY